MKYPIKIQNLIVERDDHFMVDGAEQVALRVKCKREDGGVMSALITRDPWPEDWPDDLTHKVESNEVSDLIFSLMLQLNK